MGVTSAAAWALALLSFCIQFVLASAGHTRGAHPTSVGLSHSNTAAKLEPLGPPSVAQDQPAESSLKGTSAITAGPIAASMASVISVSSPAAGMLQHLEQKLAAKEATVERMASDAKQLQGNLDQLAKSELEAVTELRTARSESERELHLAQASQQQQQQQQRVSNLAAQTSQHEGTPPCSCVPSSSSWVPCNRTTPKCIWIDLGAADGNSFNAFLQNYYGPVQNCPSGQWEAVLVEANPRFDQALIGVATQRPGSMHMYSSTAAYMCKAETSFYLDTVTHANNYWGSSMSSNAADVIASGKQKVTVPTVNLNQILYEMTIPGDWVMVKMDIEGAEWDILPCLALAPAASLIDRLFVEIHNQSMSTIGTDPATMQAAQSLLRLRGVDIPAYYSQTL